MNTAFGLAIYPALLWAFPWLRVHYMVALFIAQALSLCFAYSSYKLGVFQTRGRYAREITAFLSFYGVNYAANWIALPALVEFAHIAADHRAADVQRGDHGHQLFLAQQSHVQGRKVNAVDELPEA